MKKPTIIFLDGAAFLLPSNQGLQTIINAFAGAVRICGADYLGDGVMQYELNPEEMQIKTEVVSRKTRFVTKGGEVVDITGTGIRRQLKTLKNGDGRKALRNQETMRLL